MNALELQANRQLSDFEPKNLNIDATLPYADASFDVLGVGLGLRGGVGVGVGVAVRRCPTLKALPCP